MRRYCHFFLLCIEKHIRYWLYMNDIDVAHDEVAEWLRRWTANPLGSARVGSNPILVEEFLFLKLVFLML